VKALRDECVKYNITFVFCGTGRRFIKDGKLYKLEGNGLQSMRKMQKTAISRKSENRRNDPESDIEKCSVPGSGLFSFLEKVPEGEPSVLQNAQYLYQKVKYNKPEELSGVVNDALKK